MADTYVQFSIDVPLAKGKRAASRVNKLLREGIAARNKAREDGNHDEDTDFDFNFQQPNDHLVLYSEENGQFEHAVRFIQTLMCGGLVAEPLVAEWAETCSKMRAGAFGGGAALVTKERIYWFSPRDLADKKWKDIQKRRKRFR